MLLTFSHVSEHPINKSCFAIQIALKHIEPENILWVCCGFRAIFLAFFFFFGLLKNHKREFDSKRYTTLFLFTHLLLRRGRERERGDSNRKTHMSAVGRTCYTPALAMAYTFHIQFWANFVYKIYRTLYSISYQPIIEFETGPRPFSVRHVNKH